MAKRELVTIDVVIEELGVSRSTVWRMIRRGELSTVRVGRRRLVPKQSLRTRRVKTSRSDKPKPFTMDSPLWRLFGAGRSGGGKPSSSDKYAMYEDYGE